MAKGKSGSGRRVLKLDEEQTNEVFFDQSAFIGIISPIPASRFCWVINQHFNTSFSAEAVIEMTLKKKGKEETLTRKPPDLFQQVSSFDPVPPDDAQEPDDAPPVVHEFPVYVHNVANSVFRHLLYRVKPGKISLLTDKRHKKYDYLWMIQTAASFHDAHLILEVLAKVPAVRFAQEIGYDEVSGDFGNLLL